MCGLCGFIVKSRIENKQWINVLRSMIALLAHRGPDSDGRYFTNCDDLKFGLGHCRLSIIDPTDNANQPLGNEDNSIFVAFNGEIYNYQALTKELSNRGHRFKSKSDTEVILHLYEELGYSCIEKLDGMFAFALLDLKAKRLLLARDRIGIKPLYYSLKKGNIYFASELKSLLLIDEITREIDLEALDCYFTYGYIPGTRTIFKDIKKLLPATYLSFENNEAEIKTYWNLYYQPASIPYTQLKEQLYYLFKKAISKHVVSDVPVGAFLSGGVDSSIVVALMNEVTEGNVSTFSLGYTDGGNDELEYAETMADYCNTNHNEFKVSPDMMAILPELLWHLDEPFFDNSIIPTYLISKLAKKNVKVVLSGDGGDELFGGYEWTRRHQFKAKYELLPKFARKAINHLTPLDLDLGNEYGNDWISITKRIFNDLNSDVESGFRRRTTVSKRFRNRLYSSMLKSELGNFQSESYQRDLFNYANVQDERDKMLYVDTKCFLPDDCLYKVDRMSMASGLEVRVPFLDKDLLEFSTQIPFNYKIKNFTSKYILKDTFAAYLHPEILRQRKKGFTIPISIWIKNGLRSVVDKILFDGSLAARGFFDQTHIKWMVNNHQSGKQELGHRIWSLVVFELWSRLYLDQKITSTPNLSVTDML